MGGADGWHGMGRAAAPERVCNGRTRPGDRSKKREHRHNGVPGISKTLAHYSQELLLYAGVQSFRPLFPNCHGEHHED